MVGAVIVQGDRVVAEGWYRGPGHSHAEVDALSRLEGSAAGSTVIVNLEPCCHFGRTPPCSRALLEARVSKVVVGMVDPNPLVSGKGIRELRDGGIEVVLGVEEARCLELNRGFVERIQGQVDSGELDPDDFVPGSFQSQQREQPTRFVVLSAPRTGSNYLCSLLDSHRQILCHHELFNLDGIRYALSRRNTEFSLGTLHDRDRDPVGFARRAWARPDGARAVGFKLARRHPELVLRDAIADRGVRKILLQRNNRLKTYVSELVAQAELTWTHYGKHPDQLPRIEVDVDVEELFAFAREYDAFYDRLRRALRSRGEPWLELDYERLFLPDMMGEILAYLGFPASDVAGLRGATPKRNADDLRLVVRNYDGLERALAGTPFESDLHDRPPWLGAAPQQLRVDLLVRSVDQSRDFYTRALGMQVVHEESDGHTILRSRDVTLGLRPLQGSDGDFESNRGRRGLEVVLEVGSVDHCFARIASAGWPVLTIPETRPWGERDLRVADPDGYSIRLTERLPLTRRQAS